MCHPPGLEVVAAQLITTQVFMACPNKETGCMIQLQSPSSTRVVCGVMSMIEKTWDAWMMKVKMEQLIGI